MGKWIALFVLIISGSILGYLYVQLENTTSDTLVVVPKVTTHSLRIFHSFSAGEHRYTGEIKLPHSCYELKTQAAVDPKDPAEYKINVTSIDRLLDMRLCAQIPTRYDFDVLISAPGGIHATLFVDGQETPMRIVETSWQSPKGNSVAPVGGSNTAR